MNAGRSGSHGIQRAAGFSLRGPSDTGIVLEASATPCRLQALSLTHKLDPGMTSWAGRRGARPGGAKVASHGRKPVVRGCLGAENPGGATEVFRQSPGVLRPSGA